MNVLERYLKLRSEGKNEKEIISLLQEEGFSMAEINDAINQNTIKEAINQTDTELEYNYGDSNKEYVQDNYYPYPQDYSSGSDVETTTEIVEQIVSKKLKEILESLNYIKRELDYNSKEIESLKDRLKRMEEGFDFVQRAIIGKIGEFEENSKLVQKDLENIHGTISKLMNPLIDTYNELVKFNDKKNSVEQKQKKSTRNTDANL